MPIPSNSTLDTVWPHLVHQRAYVAGARHKMLLCAKQHGNAHVRIGITGSGQKRCYRVFYVDDAGSEKNFGSYWNNHDPLENNERAMTSSWSNMSMDFAQVDAFLKGKLGKNIAT